MRPSAWAAAVAVLVGGQGGEFQVAQHLQAVAAQIGVGTADGDIAQFRAGLDVEEEEEPVHEPQALQGECPGVERLVAAEDALFLFAGLGDEGPGGGVAQELHRLLEGVLEVRSGG